MSTPVEMAFVIRRDESDYCAVMVEAEVVLDEDSVGFNRLDIVRVRHCEDPECDKPVTGAPLPLSPKEWDRLERALEEEAKASLSAAREDFWGCRPYALEAP